MGLFSIVGMAAGIILALIVLCVILAAMFPPKEYKGDIDPAENVGSSVRSESMEVPQ